jgi:hypothetical protein
VKEQFNSFHKQHGLQQDSVKVTFISLVLFPIAATVLTIITQLICTVYTKYSKLIVIGMYKLQSTSSQPVAISPHPVRVEGNMLLQYMDNAQILHAIEIKYLVDE